MNHVEAATAAHGRSWNEIMESIVKHGSEKRSLQPITCRKETTVRTLWRREEGLDLLFPPGTCRGGGGQKEAGKENDGAGGDARGAE